MWPAQATGDENMDTTVIILASVNSNEIGKACNIVTDHICVSAGCKMSNGLCCCIYYLTVWWGQMRRNWGDATRRCYCLHAQVLTNLILCIAILQRQYIYYDIPYRKAKSQVSIFDKTVVFQGTWQEVGDIIAMFSRTFNTDSMQNSYVEDDRSETSLGMIPASAIVAYNTATQS